MYGCAGDGSVGYGCLGVLVVLSCGFLRIAGPPSVLAGGVPEYSVCPDDGSVVVWVVVE